MWRRRGNRDIERPENSPVESMDASLDALRALQRERVGRPLSMGPAGPWEQGTGNREQGTGNRNGGCRVDYEIVHALHAAPFSYKCHCGASIALKDQLRVAATGFSGIPRLILSRKPFFILVVSLRARLFLFPVDCSLFPLSYPWRFRQHLDKSVFCYCFISACSISANMFPSFSSGRSWRRANMKRPSRLL